MDQGSLWELIKDLDGFADRRGTALSTQVCKGRSFQLITIPGKGNDFELSTRVKVRLLEDGYECWFDLRDLLAQAIKRNHFQAKFISEDEIQNRLPSILKWVEKANSKHNEYLWGGTVGPNFDCSGLVQAAFASQEIWLPRDAYQQERFCKPIEVKPDKYENLLPGDLLFFGTDKRCTHVALYLKNGFYWHSSGLQNGRNAIGMDCLHPSDANPVACYYRSLLRGAGRVQCCHDGTTLP